MIVLQLFIILFNFNAPNVFQIIFSKED